MKPHDALLADIRAFRFAAPPSRPSLLFSRADADLIRQRAADRSGVLERVREAGFALLATNADDPNALQPYIGGAEAVAMADAALIVDEAEFGRWALRRLHALIALDTWFVPVHRGGCRVCDHVMGNVAAQVAVTHDTLGDLPTAADTRALVDGLRRHILDPFLDATGDNPEWWAKAATESNWKIMTCGEAGTALVSFAHHWPEAPEAIARAARGVLQTLDQVPSQGDWPEGVNYWFATLMMGLRFARALRRATAGAIDLFQHPVLKATGDFPTMLAVPGRPRSRIYNFNDNVPSLDPRSCEALVMLAAEHRRADWLGVARMFPVDSTLFLALDDPAIPSEHPRRLTASFPRSGVATTRTGWDAASDIFVGLKAGPPNVGHSHLDANSFVIEAHGKPLVIDHPYWPQAHFLGFFSTADTADGPGPRWNFDGPGTPGHSTLLIDGQGQRFGGEDRAARIVRADEQPDRTTLVGDASRCYPGLLTKFVRTLTLLRCGAIVIRDVVECDGPRHAEWLLHYAGSVASNGVVSVIENEGVRLVVTPFLPDRAMGWRITDATRTSIYENSDTRREETRGVRYRSFAPFRKARSFEFLFGLRINGDPHGRDWTFTPPADDKPWSLAAADSDQTLRPSGDSLA